MMTWNDLGCRCTLLGSGREHVSYCRSLHAGAVTDATAVASSRCYYVKHACDVRYRFTCDVRRLMLLLQGSREGQDAIVKLLQQGIPDAVVCVACDSLLFVSDTRVGWQRMCCYHATGQ